MTVYSYVISSYGNENVLKLVVVMIEKFCEYLKTIELYTLYWQIACELYLNKGGIKFSKEIGV